MLYLTDAQREQLEFLWWVIKKNWFLIPYIIIMTWGIIATLLGA